MNDIYSISIRVPENFLDKFVAILDERGLLDLSLNLHTFSSDNNCYSECNLRISGKSKDKLLNEINKINGVVYSSTLAS